MPKGRYDTAVRDLKLRKRSITRSQLIAHLSSLGFKCKLGTKGMHYTVTHNGFGVYPAGTFNGEHGNDPLIKIDYIVHMLNMLSTYEAELREFLKEPKNEKI